MKGFINLIKPEGMSSAYAVGAVKKAFNLPCGHMGTLDPMASGVLPIGVGQASRLFQFMLDKEKTYVAEFVFGNEYDTLDVTGEIVKSTDIIPTLSDINAVLSSLTGEIMQIPPKYSAKCIDGKRGYQLARKGIEFELQPKKVNILELKCLGETDKNTYKFFIKCGGGTYVRSIARDIGLMTGSLGSMKSLIRTSSGAFSIDSGVTVEEFKASLTPEKYLIPADSAVSFPKLKLTNYQATRMLNGVFENYGFSDGIYNVYNEQEFWGVGEVSENILKMKCYVR